MLRSLQTTPARLRSGVPSAALAAIPRIWGLGFFPSRIAGNYVHWRGLLGSYWLLQQVALTTTIREERL